MKNIVGISTFLGIMILISCGSNKRETEKNAEKMDSEANVKYNDPDNYFNEAIVSYEKGETTATVNRIEEARNAIQSEVIEGDTVHAKIIDLAVAELDDLQQRISSNDSVSNEDLRKVFASVDRSTGMYNLLIVEDWILNEKKNRVTLQNIHNAVVRVYYAINHVNFPITPEELSALEKAKLDIARAEQASHSLWENIKTNLVELNQRMEENENSFDGSGLD